MADYILHEGTGLEAVSEPAIKAAKAAESEQESGWKIIFDVEPVVLKRDDKTVEFSGYKAVGDQEPMTVTHMVINGKVTQLSSTITVEFHRSGEGEGKPMQESIDALERIYTEQLAKSVIVGEPKSGSLAATNPVSLAGGSKTPILS